MTEPRHSSAIVIVDREGPWRNALAQALNDEFCFPELTEDGQRLRHVLASPEPEVRVVVIGQELTGLGAAEALWHASREAPRPAVAAGQKPRPVVLMVTEVRSDVELLDLLHRRGVHGFLYRNDSIDELAFRILAAAFADERDAERTRVKLDVSVTCGEQFGRGTLEDLSRGGAQVAVANSRLNPQPVNGDKLQLQFTVEALRIRCHAVVRNVTVRKHVLGDRTVFGLQFVDLDADTQGLLEQAVERVRENQTPLFWAAR